MERIVRLGATFGAYTLGSLPNLRRRERFCNRSHWLHISIANNLQCLTASPLQICCGGCGYPPGRTLVRFSLTMRTGLAEPGHTYLLAFSAL